MPSASRSTILRRRFAVLGGLLVVILLGGYFATTSAAALPVSAATLTQPAALTQPATAMVWPGIGEGAIGAVGYDGVLGSSGSQAAVPIASITKMITSLVLDARGWAGFSQQPLTPARLCGGLLVIAGVLLISRR